MSSARIGKATEALIGASVVLTSGGALNVSTSLVDDEGVDLVFNRLGESVTLAVQVKARTTDSKRVAQGGMWAQVKASTFRPRPDLAMLFVVVDPPTARIHPVWFVPAEDFDRLAYTTPSSGGRWIRTRLADETNDKWTPYRTDLGELPARVSVLMDRLDP